jgi:S1-C subfamily serine protease
VVLAIDGRPVSEAHQVEAEVIQLSIGDTITLNILGEARSRGAAQKPI